MEERFRINGLFVFLVNKRIDGTKSSLNKIRKIRRQFLLSSN